jgi:hypothetical protein
MIAAIRFHASRFSAVVAFDRARAAFLRVDRASRTSVAVVARRASSNAAQFNSTRCCPGGSNNHRGRTRARATCASASEGKTRGKDERRGATDAARAHERG